MLRLVEARYRTQWDTLTVQSEYKTQFLIRTGFSVVSEEMITQILGYEIWSGTRYLNDDSEYEIGYGIGDPNYEQGYTEPESYAEWVGWARNRQRALRTQLPVLSLPISAWDGLFSLFLDTGDWRRVVADEGTYDLADAVRNSNWLLVADIISRGNINRNRRQDEARVIRLADYTNNKTRDQQMLNGIRKMRKRYVNGLPTEFDRRQHEFAYYRQLNGFLPGMSHLRQKRVINQSTL
jgi:hypothetical protein